MDSPNTFFLFIIPAVTLVVAYILNLAATWLPKSLMVPVVLPALGIGVNWLTMLAGADGLDPVLAGLLGGLAAGFQKAIEHASSAVAALVKGDPVPRLSRDQVAAKDWK